MVIADLSSTAISAGPKEASIPVPAAPTIPDENPSLPEVFPTEIFLSVSQISEHPLLNRPIEELSDYERGRRGELRLAKLGMNLFGNIVSYVRLVGWRDEDDLNGRDVFFVLREGHALLELYGQSKGDKTNARKERAKIRDEKHIKRGSTEEIRRAVAREKLIVVNTAATRTDEDVKDSIWKDFLLIHEVYELTAPQREDKPADASVAVSKNVQLFP